MTGRGAAARERTRDSTAPGEVPGPAGSHRYERVLMRTMMHAFYWLDDGLQAHLARQTGISVPRAQSMIMVCIGDGLQRQADLADRLGVSKQAVQQGLKELMAKGLVTVKQDPRNGRQRIVEFTAQGRRMRDIAVEGLLELEKLLAERIGKKRLEALHDALEADWGPLPEPD